MRCYYDQCPENWSVLGSRFNSEDSVTDECGHLSDAYGAFQGDSCGKRCLCMFSYTSGTELIEGMSTRFGSCHNADRNDSYCAIKESSCDSNENEVFKGVWEPESEALDCSCAETLVGACNTSSGDFIHCAVAADSCQTGEIFVGARELKESSDTNDCRLCSGVMRTESPTKSVSPSKQPTISPTDPPTLSLSPTSSVSPTVEPDAPIEVALYGGCINRSLGGGPDADGAPDFHCHFDSSYCTNDEMWLSHRELTDEGRSPCTCDHEYSTNAFTNTCYDVNSSHQLVCAAEANQCPDGWMPLGARFNSDKTAGNNCGHTSTAYDGDEQCGKLCLCAFTYTSGSKTVVAGTTEYGSCHSAARGDSYCAVKESTCAPAETFFGAFEPESQALDCTCDKTLVGACVTADREFRHCAVASDSCAINHFFIGARELTESTLKNNCRLCRDTWTPTSSPTGLPTSSPTSSPTFSPTDEPTSAPSAATSSSPSSMHSVVPTVSVSPSISAAPSVEPSLSSVPSASSSLSPTGSPSINPTAMPSKDRTGSPSGAVSISPSASDSSNPTTSTPTTASPTVTCVDDTTFRINGNQVKSCLWVSNVESRRQNACSKFNKVPKACPIACGLCCADDSNFRFATVFGIQDCAWLDNTFKQTRFCAIRDIESSCPVTCSSCYSMVM